LTIDIAGDGPEIGSAILAAAAAPIAPPRSSTKWRANWRTAAANFARRLNLSIAQLTRQFQHCHDLGAGKERLEHAD
jgi:hypothetical protein